MVVCMPIDIKFKSFATNVAGGSIISIYNIFDIFPYKKKPKEISKPKSKSKIKFVPDTIIFDVITIDKLSIVIDNFEPINGYLLVIINQFVNALKIKDCLENYEITNINTESNKPNLQIYIHFKIHLVMIFSVIFKIIKIRRKK